MKYSPILLTFALITGDGEAGNPDTKGDRMDAAPTLDIARLYAAPDLDGTSPRGVEISPDSARVTFLRGKDTNPLQMDLWEYNLADDEMRVLVDSVELVGDDEQLSEEELARRERLRIVGQRGIVSYQFSPTGEQLLFPLSGDLFLFDLASRETRQLTETSEGETDPKFSATGRYVSFVRSQNLFVIDLETRTERQLTRDGGGLIKNGMAEFIAQEEMDRYTGYWWAPDDSAIAFMRVDETPIEVAQRFEVYAEDFKVYEQRYPATGTPNAIVTLGVISLDGEKLQWMDTGEQTDIYLPRVAWFPDSAFLAVQRQSRDQQTLEVLKIDVASGESRVLITETSDIWVNLHNELAFLDSKPQFIWKSERSGHAHLYLYGNDGELISELTSGAWDVIADSGRARSAILHVDEANDRVFFTATLDSPTERNVYSVSLDEPATPVRLTAASGWHSVDFAGNGEFYVDNFQNIDTPPQLALHSVDGSRVRFIDENRLAEGHPYFPYLGNRPSTAFGTLKAEDGQALHYKLVTPANLDTSRQYPVIVSVYGGPHGPRANNTWSAGFDEVLVRNGFVVFSLDNRGTGYRGEAFDAPIYRSMGGVEVVDQMVGVEFLNSLAYVDADRIGIWGWSYGGYMALMCMFKEPDAFAAGVSGAPVTDWALYDTHYTERYMGTPQNNADGYDASSVFPYAENLNAPLLVMHGMADDNVLFSHSTKLFNALQIAGRPFDMMTYPGSKHALMRVPETGQHALEHILRFFQEHLQE